MQRLNFYINGTYKEDMRWQALDSVDEYHTPDTFFVSTIIPQAGDKVKIVATTPEYGSVWAEDVVPQRVPIEKDRDQLPERNRRSLQHTK